MKFREFLKVCHEKEVFKKLSFYIVFTWVLLQVISLIMEPMGLPKDTISVSIIVMLTCFPIYIYFVWKKHLKNIYSLKKKSLKFTDGEKKGKNYLNFQTYYFGSLGIISFISGLLVVWVFYNKFNEETVVDEIQFQDKIAVLKFENNTGNDKLNRIGDIAADWIIHGISQNKIAKVIAPDTFEEISKLYKASILPTGDNRVLQDYFKPKEIITGNYFLKNGQLIFHGSILDGSDNTVLYSFESVECDSESPLDCIELLKQKILGFLVTENKKELNLQETPPNYEAYKLVMEAKANIENHDLYIDLLNKAIEADTTYFEPQYLRVEFYYNRENYAKADSLFNFIKPTKLNNDRQKNILFLLEALLDGNNKMIYNYLQKEYNYAPFDLYKNLSMLVVAMEFVNRPQDVSDIYNEIDSKNFDIENCKYCEYRSYIQSMAYFELGEYNNIISLLKDNIEVTKDLALKRVFLMAHVKLGDYREVESIIDKYELEMDKNEWLNLCSYLGKMLLNEENDSLSLLYFNKVISVKDTLQHTKFKADAFYYTEQYDRAEELYSDLLNQTPKDIDNITKLAISYYKNGKITKANQKLKALEKLRAKYQYGALDYALGQYYSATGENKKSQNYLLRSVVSGSWFTNSTYQNDPHFRNIRTSDAFKEILNYWH